MIPPLVLRYLNCKDEDEDDDEGEDKDEVGKEDEDCDGHGDESGDDAPMYRRLYTEQHAIDEPPTQ